MNRDDVIVKIDQMWKFKKSTIRNNLKKIQKHGLLDYQLDAFVRIMSEVKFKIIKIEQEEKNIMETFVYVKDVGPAQFIIENNRFHIGNLLRECELDEFST